MKTYIKPEAELLELEFVEDIMSGYLDSTEWGVEDGLDIPD